MKIKAYTLAEILIVVGVIGVVAALSMPNLVNNSKDKTIVSGLKKNYAVLSQAYATALQEEPLNKWFEDADTEAKKKVAFFKHLLPYLKISQNCVNMTNGSKLSSCANPAYLNGTASYPYVILSDGTIVVFRFNSFTASKLASIDVNVDGQKGKNKKGDDIFFFGVYRNGRLVPDDTTNGTTALNSCLNTNRYCTTWVLENGNREYLKCNNLTWTKTTCD